MTAALRKEFIERLGTGTGPTRYRQLHDLCNIAGLNPEGSRAITGETIENLKGLGPDEWIEAFRQYRAGTKGNAVRLSEYGLQQVRGVIAAFATE